MTPKNRIIIDTDPGIDDVLAVLLALSASAEELEVLLISVSYGNVDVRACLRNIVAIFYILNKEIQWRKSQGSPVGFEGVTKFKPLVAIGADLPLNGKIGSKDYFHGRDGVAGTTKTHPQFSPDAGWEKLFEKSSADSVTTTAVGSESSQSTVLFQPSLEPAHKEMLRLLRKNEPNTITLISLGPLTNFALAAAEDPETFLRAKEIVTMGGTVDGLGNVTPTAEFNIYADPEAAARVFALSSQVPSSTMPAIFNSSNEKAIELPDYPATLSKQAKITLMSLDITEYHALSRGQFNTAALPLASRKSPLAEWMVAFMTPMLDKMDHLNTGHEGDSAALALHDPLCVWYILTQDHKGWKPSPKSPEDIRVETVGQWTRGTTVGDKRTRKRRDSDGERPYDHGNWLGNHSGNRIWRMLESPGRKKAPVDLLRRILGVEVEEEKKPDLMGEDPRGVV